VPAWVDQIGAGTYGLFPNAIRLKKGARYTARLSPTICDFAGNCTAQPLTWSFTVAPDPDRAHGDTSIPAAFSAFAP